MTKVLLTRELNLYFAKIRKEDQIMSFEKVEKYTVEELNTICLRRGIAYEDKTQE
jgi:hypothetical protein